MTVSNERLNEILYEDKVLLECAHKKTATIPTAKYKMVTLDERISIVTELLKLRAEKP